MYYVLIFVEAVFMYFVAYLLIRLNRKGIGEQTSYDYTLLIILGAVAAVPLGNEQNITATIIALIGIWTGHKITISAAKINFLRTFLHGQPKYLIRKGSFDVKEFYASRLTVAELYSELRLNGHSSLSDIEWALIEPSGKISFILKIGSQFTPICVEPIIVEGVVQQKTLLSAEKDEIWLNSQIKHSGFTDPNEILIAELTYDSLLNVIAKRPS
jgi:uncharacterized membrane protein YcaP (DUF421 family)